MTKDSDTKELGAGPRHPAGPAGLGDVPALRGDGRMGGRACPLCEGSGKLNAAVAEDPDDPEEIAAGPTDAG